MFKVRFYTTHLKWEGFCMDDPLEKSIMGR